MNETDQRDLVSVVIPCYQQAQYLPEAIESVLAQTYPWYEIIVVDDGSPDPTREVARRYPGVRYLRQANQGLSAARNTGIRHSRGTYMVFLDADDWLLPHHFEASLRAFREHPDAAFVCGDYRWRGDPHATHVHMCRPQPDHYATLLRFNFIGPPHVAMFKRDVLFEIGLFRVALRSCEDQDLYLRIARNYPIYCHHEVVAEYRRHPMQMSRQWDVMLQAAMAVLRSQEPYVKGHPYYARALRAGIRFRQQLYGEPLAWQTVSAIRSHEWSRAVRNLGVLLRFYPQGLLMLLRHKMRQLVVRQESPSRWREKESSAPPGDTGAGPGSEQKREMAGATHKR